MINSGIRPTNAQVGRSKTQTDRKVGAMSNYTTRTPAKSLSVGQMVRGEVIDLRNREITITMEDNTTVTGLLPDSSHLSIGETAAFFITGISPDKISLELVQSSLQSSERVTIHKALEESGLPINEKNQSIVRELLHNNMPIHKQSISNILTQSYQFPNVSIPVLVAMNRLGMNITATSASQFENCCTRENTLADDASTLSAALLYALKDTKTLPNADLVKQLLSLLSFPETETTEHDAETFKTSPAFMGSAFANRFGLHRLADFLSAPQPKPLPAAEAGMLSPASREEFLQEISSFIETQKQALEELTKPEKPVNPMAFYQKTAEISEELQTLLDRINTIETQLTDRFSTEQIPLRDAITFFEEGQQLADDLDFFQIQETRKHFLEKHPTFPELLETSPDSEECTKLSSLLEQTLQKVPSSTSLLSSALLERMEQEYTQYLSDKGTIAALLSTKELQELIDAAEAFPFHPHMKKLLRDGDVTPKEFFTVVRNTSSLVPEDALQAMVSTDAFGKLLKQPFLSAFTLTPHDLLQPKKAEEFFDKTYTHLQELSHTLSEFSKNGGNSDFLDLAQQKSEDMQKQLEFLKSINEMYTYVQIPVKLRQGIKTSDLYVYTKKEAMRSNSKDISALLHLDMDFLGPLDIHVTLHHATVTAHIYCQDENMKKFLSTQISSLKTALNLRGYLLEADVAERQKPFDFVKDFIQKKEQPSSNQKAAAQKRYTFDIRA